jgi:hypothetical protein
MSNFYPYDYPNDPYFYNPSTFMEANKDAELYVDPLLRLQASALTDGWGFGTPQPVQTKSTVTPPPANDKKINIYDTIGINKIIYTPKIISQKIENNNNRDKSSVVIGDGQKTPEDSRVIFKNDNYYLLYNRVKQTNGNRSMHLLNINTNEETDLCIDQFENFEKNWGIFQDEGRTKYVYSIDPFIIISEEETSCARQSPIYYNLFFEIRNKYKNQNNIDVHVRNSSKLVLKDGLFYGLGHIVFELKNSKSGGFEKLIDESHPEYNYFKGYPKIYLGFVYNIKKNNDGIYVLNEISDFFQISKRKELINFFCDIDVNDNNIYIAHGIGDTEAHISKLNLNDLNLTNIDEKDSVRIFRKNFDENNIDLTNIFKNIFKTYGFFENNSKNKFINITNPGFKYIENDICYISCRVLYGNIRNWTGKNYVLLIKMNLSNKNITEKKLIFYNKKENKVLSFGNIEEYKNYFKYNNGVITNIQEVKDKFSSLANYNEINNLNDQQFSKFVMSILRNNNYLIPNDWLPSNITFNIDISDENIFNETLCSNIMSVLLNDVSTIEKTKIEFYQKYLKYKRKYLKLQKYIHVGGAIQKITVDVGRSDNQVKNVDIPLVYNIGDIPNNDEYKNYNDRFQKTITPSKLIVKRTDNADGWGQPLTVDLEYDDEQIQDKLNVGSSGQNVKNVPLPPDFTIVDNKPSNSEYQQHNDTFALNVIPGNVLVKRTDSNNGWGQDLTYPIAVSYDPSTGLIKPEVLSKFKFANLPVEFNTQELKSAIVWGALNRKNQIPTIPEADRLKYITDNIIMKEKETKKDRACRFVEYYDNFSEIENLGTIKSLLGL